MQQRLLPWMSIAAALAIYVANGTTLSSGDTLPARYLPLILLETGRLTFDAYPSLYTPLPYYLMQVHGHIVSAYPIGSMLVAWPFYVPFALFGLPVESPFLEHLEKFAAASIVALSVGLLSATLIRLTAIRWAWLLTLAYAFGTSSLSTSSQALFQHGPSQLLLTLTLYMMVRGRDEPQWISWAGLPLGLTVLCRPTNLVIALPLVVYVLWRHRPQAWRFVLSGLPPVAFQLWYNVSYFGDSFWTQFPVSGVWTTPWLKGAPGILISPTRGLFFYSPILLGSVVGAVVVWRRTGDALQRASSVSVLLTVLLYSRFFVWWGGHSYGPRLLADLTPLLVLLLVPLGAWWAGSPIARGIMGVLLVWSIVAHAIGAFAADPLWNGTMEASDASRGYLWSWTQNELVNPPLRLVNRLRRQLGHLPDSRHDAEQLAVRYTIPWASPLQLPTGQPVTLSLHAHNTGTAVWLTWPRGAVGRVALEWRWLRDEVEVADSGGRSPLLTDVFPQASTPLRVACRTPDVPGTYVLQLSLLSERRHRFGLEQIPVTLIRPSGTMPSPALAIPTTISLVRGLPLNTGQKGSLISKLDTAWDSITRGNLNAACDPLQAFENEVNSLAQGGQLNPKNAAPMLGEAQAIQLSLGCL